VKSRSCKQLFELPTSSYQEKDQQCEVPSDNLVHEHVSPVSTEDHSYSQSVTKHDKQDKEQNHDHAYLKTVVKTKETDKSSSVYQQQKGISLQPVEINETDKELFKQADASDSIENILKELIRIPTVYDKLWQNILIHLSTEIDLISGLQNPTVLRSKLAEINPETFLKEILMEMHQRCPKVLQFLMTIAIPLHIAMPEKSHVIAANVCPSNVPEKQSAYSLPESCGCCMSKIQCWEWGN